MSGRSIDTLAVNEVQQRSGGRNDSVDSASPPYLGHSVSTECDVFWGWAHHARRRMSWQLIDSSAPSLHRLTLLGRIWILDCLCDRIATGLIDKRHQQQTEHAKPGWFPKLLQADGHFRMPRRGLCAIRAE